MKSRFVSWRFNEKGPGKIFRVAYHPGWFLRLLGEKVEECEYITDGGSGWYTYPGYNFCSAGVRSMLCDYQSIVRYESIPPTNPLKL